MTMPRPDRMGAHRANYEKNKKRILATQNVCGICGKPIDVIEDWPSHGRDEQKIYDRMNY